MPLIKKELFCGSSSELIEHFKTYINPTPKNFEELLSKNEVNEDWVNKCFEMKFSIESQINDLVKRKLYIGIVFYYRFFEDEEKEVNMEVLSQAIQITNKEVVAQLFKEATEQKEESRIIIP